MTKKELRRIHLDKRKALSKTEINQISLSISELFFNFYQEKDAKIHVFLPILNQNEINTNFIIQNLFNETKCTVITSKSDFKTIRMTHFIINKDTHFENDKYNIPTPVNGVEISAKEIDCILVPLLCIDKNGFRVGYGKGFYDRFIAECRIDVKTIGLSISEPIDNISDLNAFDIALDYCITPKTIHHFKQ